MQNQQRKPEYEAAPAWAGDGPRRRTCPELVLLDLGEASDTEWTVAIREEVDAITDADSPTGGLLRTHSGVLRLTHLTYN